MMQRVIGCVSILLLGFLLVYQYQNTADSDSLSNRHPNIVIIGATLLDFLAEPDNEELLLQTSNPGFVHHSWGGVSRNIAQSVAVSLPELDPTATVESVFFVSVIGKDIIGQTFYPAHTAFDTTGVKQLEGNTGVYLAIAEGKRLNGDMHTAIAEVDILKKLSPSFLKQFEDVILQSKLVAIDANLSPEAIRYLTELCDGKVDIWFEPTSVPKSCLIFKAEVDLNAITYISPNVVELEAMAEYVKQKNTKDSTIGSAEVNLDFDSNDGLKKEKQYVLTLLNSGIKNVLTTLGPRGTLLGFFENENPSSVSFIHFPAPPADVIQVNGAGDAMAGCTISSIITERSLNESIEIGHLCAKLQLEGKSLSELPALLLKYQQTDRKK